MPKAIILAGGRGTRLKSLVRDRPKPMAEICGRPFLEILMAKLVDQGINNVTISVGYKHEYIIEYFGNSWRSIDITYSIETKPLGTGGAIKYALSEFSDEEPVLVLNGDSYVAFYIQDFVEAFETSDADIGIVAKWLKHTSRYGILELSDDRQKIISFSEKQGEIPGYINTGVYLLRKSIFHDLVLPESFSFEKEMLERNVRQKYYMAYTKDVGNFIDIGVPADYKMACNNYSSIFDGA